MARLLELYRDGRLYEIEEDQAVSVTETHGQVDELIDALQFSTAKTLYFSKKHRENDEQLR